MDTSHKTVIFDQMQALIRRDFKLKYNSTALGFLWSLFVPVLQSLIYWSVFQSVVRFGIDDYLLYMLTGMFLWHFFSGSVSISRKCFISNSALIKKTSMNRSLLVFSRVLTELLHLLLVIPILVVLMFFYGKNPSWSLLTLPWVIAVIFLFTTGICFFVATLNLYLRDLERILSVILHALFFMSPIFYSFENLRGGIGQLLRFNPFAYFIMAWRDIFYAPQINFTNLFWITGAAIIAFTLGFWLYRWREPDFAERM